jgi:hypothetical protein
MNPKLSDEEIEALARKRAGAKMGWFIHATVFVLVNLFIFVRAESSGRAWSYVPLLGWGFGLAMHGLAVFVLGDGSGVRQRMVQRERERLQREQNREP